MGVFSADPRIVPDARKLSVVSYEEMLEMSASGAKVLCFASTDSIAKRMIDIGLSRLPGYHVYLFTDDAKGLYETCGFEVQGIGMGRVVGDWLVNAPAG